MSKPNIPAGFGGPVGDETDEGREVIWPEGHEKAKAHDGDVHERGATGAASAKAGTKSAPVGDGGAKRSGGEG